MGVIVVSRYEFLGHFKSEERLDTRSVPARGVMGRNTSR